MIRLQRKITLLGLLLVGIVGSTLANIDPAQRKLLKDNASDQVTLRAGDCLPGSSRYDQQINNVRAALLINGDVWWDKNNAVYIVPKVQPGTGAKAVSSIFAGSVWLGGKDPAGNLKLAASLYAQGTVSDFWPGPLSDNNGTTNKKTCENWDKHFVVFRTEIDSARKLWNAALAAAGGVGQNAVVPDGLIPESVKGWPASRNRFFYEVNRFVLPVTTQGYGKFHDENGNQIYEPDRGDYPTIDVKRCNVDVYPDEMVYWIYNDNGAVHTNSAKSEPIQMEVQVQAFGYQTNDFLNDMTFQRYKLINRAKTDIDSMYFAMFVDADLGCYTDDYVGCDTSRSLAYYYNQDTEDGTTGIVCDGGVNTYGTKIPIMGIDYFRGPNDANGKELGMSSFTYFNNRVQGNPPAGTTDPATAIEFYYYLTGRWKDGTPYTYGGTGYNPGGTGRKIKYAYVDAPNLTGPNIWSMCYPEKAPTTYDRRTIQATGPLLLKPGAVNELIIGIPWVPDQKYDCPSITRLQEADDIAQALFDNCFKIFDGPDAPDVTWVELENEIVAVLSNSPDSTQSNNAKERYKEPGLKIPRKLPNGRPNPDTNYVFEGYKIYQLQNGDVGVADLNNVDKARLVGQVDVQNNVTRMINWVSSEDPNFPGRVYNTPTVKVSSANKGIEHTFSIKDDRFALGDNKKLVNHKKYYYTVIAYAYNEYEVFDALKNQGQREMYVEGRRNIGDKTRGNKPYVVTPRPITDQLLYSKYGEGPQITRLDGVGDGGKFIDITEETLTKILNGTGDGTLTYQPGLGPIDVKIYNPIEVLDGTYTLEMRDGNMADDILDPKATWVLKRDGDTKNVISESSIDKLNEQVIAKYGFSLAIGQVTDAGNTPTTPDKKNGSIGSTVTYKTTTGGRWLQALPDDAPVALGALGITNDILNYLKTRTLEPDFDLDPFQGLGSTNPNFLFVPYGLCDYRDNANQFYLTPAWMSPSNATARANNKLENLNNVNIVFTSDKSKWSRCAVVETAVPFYYDGAVHSRSPQMETQNVALPASKAVNFNLRNAPSVGKDAAGGDNTPAKQVTAAEQAVGITYGMGWFPGYAVDVETGERLNIFFGENSCFDTISRAVYEPGSANVNRDMMFNPTTQAFLPYQGNSTINPASSLFFGGQHYVYVMKTKYDECLSLAGRLKLGGASFQKTAELRNVAWAGMIFPASGTKFLSYKDGLIPNDATVAMRVNNPYAPVKGKGTNGNHPAYKFTLTGKQAAPLATQTQIDSSLNFINVVPNPYYGFSAYEINEFSSTIKITNLPPQCKVSIYTLDGRFIRQFNRDEKPIPYPELAAYGNRSKQITPDLEWDLKNDKNIPVSSGVYLINVDAGALGQRVLKFFAINRQFDPSRL
jgi:hypothetical protein